MASDAAQICNRCVRRLLVWLATLDFLYCMMLASVGNVISHEAITVVGNFLWRDELLRDRNLAAFIARSQSVHAYEINLGSQPILRYLVAKVPKAVWARAMELEFYLTDFNISTARAWDTYSLRSTKYRWRTPQMLVLTIARSRIWQSRSPQS